MSAHDDEEKMLRSVSLQNATSILQARNRIEEELTYSLSLMQATLESTTDGILVTDLQGRIKAFNKKLLGMWRKEEADMRENSHQDVIQGFFDQLRDPIAARNRIEQIYRDMPEETHDVLEFTDGRVFERFSNVQIHAGERVGRVWSYRDVSIKSQQNEALRISEEFNRTIIESSRDCLNILTLSGHLIWMSERGLALYGLSKAGQLLGRSWIEIWRAADHDLARAAIDEAAQGHEKHFTGACFVQNQERWMEVVISPIFDATGKPERLLAVSRDVTERRLADEELRRSENRFRELADSMPQIVWAANAEGFIDYYNQQWFEYTGVPDAEAEEPSHWAKVVHADDLKICLEHWNQALRDGAPFTIEFRLKTSGGQYRWQLGRARPVRNDQGQIVRWYGSCTDIHAHKLTEVALRDETRVLELLNRTGAALSSTLDLQELMQITTDAGKVLTGAGYAAFYQVDVVSEVRTLRLQALSGITDEQFGLLHRFMMPLVMDSILTGKNVISCGQIDNQHYTVASVVGGSGETLGGLLFGQIGIEPLSEKVESRVRGITAQAAIAMDNARLYADVKKAAVERERLLEAERASRTEAERMNVMKDEFLATLSHELRTPMNAIQGWSEILMLDEPAPQDLRLGLDSIWRNAKAQTQLIEDLLDMSRIISGKVLLDVEQIEVGPIIDAAYESVQFSAQAKGVLLSKIVEVGSGCVVGDPGRLQQIVWNLLSNAVKFTSRGGSVELRVEYTETQIEIMVKDNGIGIKPEFLPHVFERFRQADSTLTRKYGGLGLGLAIVKQLTEIHGGSVRAESDGEGQGARFIVNLPRTVLSLRERLGSNLPAKAKVFPTHQVDLSGVTVLVIDDERDALELIARVLQQYKAEVFVAASAAEGQKMLLERHPDVIVSDISMPGKDGYQFMEEVRSLSDSRGGRTPAIALTAFARSEDRQRAMSAGYQAHITKPVEVHKLATTIGNLARSKN